MTYKEFVIEMDKIKVFQMKDKLFNDGLMMAFHSSMNNEFIWELLDHYVDLLQRVVNDKGEFISWYIFDNNFGKGTLRAGKDGKRIKKIMNYKQLWELIK